MGSKLKKGQKQKLEKVIAALMEDKYFAEVWSYLEESDVIIHLGSSSSMKKIEETTGKSPGLLYGLLTEPRIGGFYYDDAKYISIKRTGLFGAKGDDLLNVVAEELFHAFQSQYYSGRKEGLTMVEVEVEAKLFTAALKVDDKSILNDGDKGTVEYSWSMEEGLFDMISGAVYSGWSFPYQIYYAYLNSSKFQLLRAYKISLDESFSDKQSELKEYYSLSDDSKIGSGYEAFSAILNKAIFGTQVGSYKESNVIEKTGKTILNSPKTNNSNVTKSKNPRFL